MGVCGPSAASSWSISVRRCQRLTEAHGQVNHPRLVLGPVLLLFQSRQFAIELVSLGGQAAVASHHFVEMFDLLADFFALGRSWTIWHGPPLRSRMRLREVSNSPITSTREMRSRPALRL